jgi:membrane protease subunit (stomatin/prohibitin family)
MQQQKQSAAQSVTNLTQTLQRAMVRKVELLDELEQVNKTISGIREGLAGVKLGENLALEMAAERAKREEADRAAHKAASAPKDISN